MLITKAQREAIENVAAMFFEGSDDICAVSSSIEDVIDRRLSRSRVRSHHPDIVHGATCDKRLHINGSGYLHAEDDDKPYIVDGLRYCGRCHTWLG